MVLDNSSRVQVVVGHASADVQGETIVLHQGEAVYYGLNATGTVVWQALKEPHTIAELALELQARFDVSEAEALRDVKRLVQELLQKKLIELLPS